MGRRSSRDEGCARPGRRVLACDVRGVRVGGWLRLRACARSGWSYLAAGFAVVAATICGWPPPRCGSAPRAAWPARLFGLYSLG